MIISCGDITIGIDREWLVKCPLCKGDLCAYSIMGLSRTESCYCPECDIVRSSVMSIPYLCTKCYSRSFYDKDGKHYCWLCGNDKFVGIKYKDAEEGGLFETEGFKLSGRFVDKDCDIDKCKHENYTNHRHKDTIFKVVCNDCGYIEYVMIPKWLQEEKKMI